VDHTAELLTRLPTPQPDRESFQKCFDAAAEPPTDAIDRAAKFLTRRRLSQDGLGRDLAWANRFRGKRHRDGAVWDLASSWRSIRELLLELADRLRGVEIRHAPALDVIREFDGPDTLTYADPPYLPSTRTAHGTYAHEMTEAEHVALLEVLLGCRGWVFVSGYPSALYDQMLVGWDRIEFDMPNHSGQGETKQRRTEVVWSNVQMGL
jgi:DNA adenine methylase